MEHPPAECKYHRVDDEEEGTPGFQKVAAETAQMSVNQPFSQIAPEKILSTSIVAGVDDLTEKVMHKLTKATVDGVEKIRQTSRTSADATHREMKADAAGDEAQKEAPDHKEKEDRTPLLDNDSEDEGVPGRPKSTPMATMKKAMGDTAKMFSGVLNNMAKAKSVEKIRQNSCASDDAAADTPSEMECDVGDAAKMISGTVNNTAKATLGGVEKTQQTSYASDDTAVDISREMECDVDGEEKEEKTPFLDNDSEEETVPGPPRSTPMAAMKKMMGDTAKIVSDKVRCGRLKIAQAIRKMSNLSLFVD